MKNILFVCLAQVMATCSLFCAADKPAFTLEVIAPDNPTHEVVCVATNNPDASLENFAVELKRSVSPDTKKAVEIAATDFLLAFSRGKREAFETTAMRMHLRVAFSLALDEFNKNLALLVKDPAAVSEYIYFEKGEKDVLYEAFVTKNSEGGLPTKLVTGETRNWNSYTSFIRPSGNKIAVKRAGPAPQKTEEFE